MTRRAALLVIAAACALPRLVVLAYERNGLLESGFIEKSAEFARTFTSSGTFGFIPDQPSAYTQPLYAFVLVPVYAAADSPWLGVGLLQIALAVGTAWLVYEIGRRVASPRAGVLAALLTTLHPYLVWHDVHVNREIVDQPLAAGAVLAVLLAGERLTRGRVLLVGVLMGLTLLANVRLALLPLVAIAYLAWQHGPGRRVALAGVAVLATTALVVTPWVVRNRVSVGCWAVTTDSRALWKANNLDTERALRGPGWIDYVRSIPGTEMSPQSAGRLYRDTGRVVDVDECGQLSFYQDRTVEFWEEHPGQKAELAGLAVRMLWSPFPTEAEDRPRAGTWLDFARRWSEPLFVVALYGFALAGAFLLPRRFVVLAVSLLAVQTLAAAVFVGSNRYRVPWDFLLAVAAAAAIDRVLERVNVDARLRARRAGPRAAPAAAPGGRSGRTASRSPSSSGAAR